MAVCPVLLEAGTALCARSWAGKDFLDGHGAAESAGTGWRGQGGAQSARPQENVWDRWGGRRRKRSRGLGEGRGKEEVEMQRRERERVRRCVFTCGCNMSERVCE